MSPSHSCLCWFALGALNPHQRMLCSSGALVKPPQVVSVCMGRGLGPQIREFEVILSQKSAVWKMLLLVLQSSRQRRIQRKRVEAFHLPCLSSAPKKLNETCDFLCIICTTTRIPLLIKSICLTILSRSPRNQYSLPREPQPL